MQRRDFLKISAAGGAAAALEGCGNPDHQLIRFIPEEDLLPGIATWKPSICTLCPAGCGMLVRVMQGEAEVVRNGQLGILKMGLAKKIEGNPAHPISQGKLCPRGQADCRSPIIRTASRLRCSAPASAAPASSKKSPGTKRSSNSSRSFRALLRRRRQAQGQLAFVSGPLRRAAQTMSLQRFRSALSGATTRRV